MELKGDHMIFRGNVRGGGQASLTEYKGGSYRKLTANEGGIVKMLQSLMGDHVHSSCHNQIPPTSLSDKKRQKKRKGKELDQAKTIRSALNYITAFYFLEKHDYYCLILFVSERWQLCDSKLTSRHVLLVRLKFQPGAHYPEPAYQLKP